MSKIGPRRVKCRKLQGETAFLRQISKIGEPAMLTGFRRRMPEEWTFTLRQRRETRDFTACFASWNRARSSTNTKRSSPRETAPVLIAVFAAIRCAAQARSARPAAAWAAQSGRAGTTSRGTSARQNRHSVRASRARLLRIIGTSRWRRSELLASPGYGEGGFVVAGFARNSDRRRSGKW